MSTDETNYAEILDEGQRALKVADRCNDELRDHAITCGQEMIKLYRSIYAEIFPHAVRFPPRDQVGTWVHYVQQVVFGYDFEVEFWEIGGGGNADARLARIPLHEILTSPARHRYAEPLRLAWLQQARLAKVHVKNQIAELEKKLAELRVKDETGNYS